MSDPKPETKSKKPEETVRRVRSGPPATPETIRPKLADERTRRSRPA